MAERPFVHLHCHSHYSLLDGANRIPELVAHVKRQGMSAIALTDHGNLYGAVEFYRECRSAGLNPIIGYEAYVAPNKRTDREQRKRNAESDDAIYHHLTLLAKDLTGFKNLIKMSSLAFLEGYHYKPRIDKELLETFNEGVICLSGCAAAEFSDWILRDRLDEARQLAEYFARVFKDRFYVEIQNNGLEIQRQCAAGAVDIANRLGLPLVATSDAHYLRQEDSVAHDVLLCINTGRTRDNPNRFKFEGNQFHVRAPEEMYSLFPGQEAAVRRSQEIADAVHIELDFKKRHFPVFTPPAGKTPDDYLRELCTQGLVERCGKDPSAAAQERLEHEIDIICRMGFASYFLIVSDFVRFAVDHGIPAGARGSACGALVSYVLGLSHVDPLEYDLLFERFLDPNRSESPDIDIDFCQERREEVIAYVKHKYGEASVAQIATFGTLAARAAIKDVGRVLNIPLERVVQLTNMVPKELGITLDDALKKSRDLRQAYDSDSDVKELIDIARRLEGTNRNAGTHAAGVVIANGPLIDYVPVHRVVRKGNDGDSTDEPVVTTQWGMDDLEKVGLLKMDFLGLRTLTLLDKCVRMVAQTRGLKLDIHRLPLDDEETFQLLQRGDAKGVFQLESDGIRELLKRLRPDTIRDIIALMALYRPGPLEGGMIDEYIECKHGRKQPVYPHPVMAEVLGETYGVMVYQEQIMRILNRLGGIELASAYACIKAISKKKQETIDERRVEFIKGSGARGMAAEKAEEIFGLIVKFGGYGFNKSHSCAYALVSYQTAYLKCHFPAEFMACLLSSEIEDGNKRDIMVEHIGDARRLGVEVVAPSVNGSEVEFSVKDGKILFGLLAIKGFGRQAAESVVRARAVGGSFKDVFDFCERVDLRLVNRTATERLIKAGALDGLPGHRAQQLAALGRAIQAASERQNDLRVGQRNLFDGAPEEADAAVTPEEVLPEVPPWPEPEKLKYEKEALDFYFSSHPLAQSEKELRRYAVHEVARLRTLPDGESVTLGGMLSQLRFMNVKKARNGNTRMMRCKLEDLSGQAECLMWPDDLARYQEAVAADVPLIVKGTVDKTRNEPGLVLQRVLTLPQAARELTREVHLLVRLKSKPAIIDALAEVLQRSRGHCPVILAVRDESGRDCLVRLGRDFAVNPHTVEQEALEGLLGSGSVKLV
jgi:DNA polymerase-3 subunit alpha